MTAPATRSPAPAPATPPPVYAATRWPVWSMEAELVVAGPERLPEARSVVESVLDEVDRTCSRFRADSDLARVNEAVGRWVAVDPVLATVLTAALRAARVTGGLVDPTVGRLVHEIGYGTDIELVETVPHGDGDGIARVPAPDPVDEATDDGARGPAAGDGPAAGAWPDRPEPSHSWRQVEISWAPPTPAVRIPVGTALDLGAVGKAWAVDRAASDLAAAGIDAMVAVGGDAAVAPTGRPHPWRVEVAEVPGGRVHQRVVIRHGAIATSTTTHRRWRHAGGVAHHVVDPRTGRPAHEWWRTVSVVAASAADANTAATAAIVLGHGAVDWLRRHGLAARLVGADGAVATVGGWPTGGEPPHQTTSPREAPDGTGTAP